MENTSEKYLSHLNNCIPKRANNYMLSTYSIILEAWRRGLEVTIRIVLEKSGNIEPYYSITDGKKTHNFSATRGDLVSKEAKILTKNKQSAKEYLIKNNVPTPIGKEFNETISNSKIIEYAKELDYPIVVKPLQGTGGTGVIGNIQNEEELIEALDYVRRDLKLPHILLEKYHEGLDYRIYVVNGEVIGALKRIRSHITGDGKNTIKDLINQKNKIRRKLPSLSNRPIKIDAETKNLLKRKNYDLNTVIPEGEVFYLKSKNNISAGGDSVDVTDLVSKNIKKIAVEATKSFPSLPHCGLDMIVDEASDTGVVIELNSRAHITQHLFPMEGHARDIPTSIIDYYFPNTKNQNREEVSKLYIDYDFIYNSCLSRTAQEIKLPKITESPIILKRYLLSNCQFTEQFANRIRRTAFNHKVNGYIKPLDNGNIVIVTGATKQKAEQFEKLLKNIAHKFFNNVQIVEKSRVTPIKHGFHIEADMQTINKADADMSELPLQKYSKLKEDYQKITRKLAEYEQKESIMELTKKQNKQLKKQLLKIENSTSWKITKPVRAIAKFKK
ncbi:hypothetical protein QGM71_20975 [Virgibacillus sp. C22-A2]|uniref:ATP-grasp domain-containing protein n=1 Tax=Virgibacillus tibetensis TaxID=3042313 RepID=A0ABU6KLC7_9BACI|nr:hypothetical protein [Virgibacillus sp. C22-A2]